MSYQAYKDDVASNRQWQEKYLRSIPVTHGIVKPSDYTVPPAPYVLDIPAGRVDVAPLYLNPSAILYHQGSDNQVLLASGHKDCDGCFSGINKPDPRLKQVKPLYNQSVYTADYALPNPYNVVGMY